VRRIKHEGELYLTYYESQFRAELAGFEAFKVDDERAGGFDRETCTLAEWLDRIKSTHVSSLTYQELQF